MSEKFQEKLGDLNLTQDELKRFSEAMKKEEFRKMLIEYAEEISDPKNRELYETEITKLENERGMNVTFIHPEPGYCIKTTQVSSTSNVKKCFINICKNVNVEKPTCSRTNSNAEDGKPGMYWSIPHTCTPPREDYDNKKIKCDVYDVVFHPDAYRMGETNKRFNLLLRDTALSTVEKNFNVKIDKVNLKVMQNLNFKGRPVAATIKKPMSQSDVKTNENDTTTKSDPIAPLIDQLKEQYYENQTKKSKINPSKQKQEPVKTQLVPSPSSNDPQYTEPVYTIVHRGQVDFQDCANQLDNLNGSRIVNSTRPKELFISIQLPLCKSSENVTLDIFEKSLHLESTNPNYKLNLNLPFPINENESKAKFDKSKRCLNLTLQVVPFVAQVDVVNSNCVEMIDDNEISSSFSPSSSSISSSESLTEYSNSLSPSPSKLVNEIKYNLPHQCSIKEYKNKIVMRLTVFNYDKSSIRLHIDNESTFNVTCESLSSSGTYIQYYAAYVRFYYVKCLERQRKPLSIYDSDLNAYSCIEKPSNFEISHLNDDSFEIKLNRNVKEIEQDFNDIEIKKACIALKQVQLNEIEDLSINGNENSASFLIIDLNQDFVNENECNDLTKTANSMSKKDFMLNFNAISNSENLDEDDDDIVVEGERKMNENKGENNSSDTNPVVKNNVNMIKPDKKISQETSKLISMSDKANGDEVSKSNDEEDDGETDYFNNVKTETVNDRDEIRKEKRLSTSSLSNSITSDSFSSSLNNSSSFNRLKGILKKPRSCSESESTTAFYNNGDSLTNSFKNCFISSESGGSNSVGSDIDVNNNNELSSSKKSVSFNKQVVRNVFKPGSTVIGMKKPGSSKNKKKNKRNRTVSDPSHDSNADAITLKDSATENTLRNRSLSESSDDSSSLMTNSNESLQETHKQSQSQSTSQTVSSPKNKKKKKKKSQQQKQQENNQAPMTTSTKVENEPKPNNQEETTKTFDMETMLQWKNQGILPTGDVKHVTSSAVKLKNSIINDLDD